MSVTGTRAELVDALEEILELQRRLVAAARSSKVPVTDLVAQVSVIERLDDRRDDLLGELRRLASKDLRRARPGRPVREAALDTLKELRWPQNAAFLEEFLWATHQLQVDSRAFAPLRRDERRAWERAPESRAFVAPALSEDGIANPRWLTSSAWPLERRIVTTSSADHLDLQKILSLVGRPDEGEDTARPWRATDALLDRYAQQVLKMDPIPMSASPQQALEWRRAVYKEARVRVSEIRRDDDRARQQAAARLANLPLRERIWGRAAAGGTDRVGTAPA
jgi:hypothetical protein